MTSLAELQREFEGALNGEAAPLHHFKPSQAMGNAQRFDVYRNNVMGAKIRALEGLYPALRALVGENFFTQAARDYSRQSPWGSGSLLTFGLELGTFLKDYPPAQNHLYLADVALLEAAVHCAYISADTPPLNPESLTTKTPEQMAALRFKMHPGAQLLHTETPASRLWEAAFHPDVAISPIDINSGPEWLLIIRPVAEVEVRRLDAGGFVFLTRINEGATLETAYNAAFQCDLNFNLTQALEAHLSGASFADCF